jgi:ApaG protein
MLKTPYTEMTRDIELRITPMYLSEYSIPKFDEYAFLYKVELINSFDDDIQIISKEVTIRDGNRNQYTLEFEDVNDEQACIPAGDTYDYTTYCPLDTPTGNLRGFLLVRNMRTNEFFEILLPLVFFRTEDKAEHFGYEYEIPYAASM